jgi:hypothetical protein
MSLYQREMGVPQRRNPRFYRPFTPRASLPFVGKIRLLVETSHFSVRRWRVALRQWLTFAVKTGKGKGLAAVSAAPNRP